MDARGAHTNTRWPDSGHNYVDVYVYIYISLLSIPITPRTDPRYRVHTHVQSGRGEWKADSAQEGGGFQCVVRVKVSLRNGSVQTNASGRTRRMRVGSRRCPFSRVYIIQDARVFRSYGSLEQRQHFPRAKSRAALAKRQSTGVSCTIALAFSRGRRNKKDFSYETVSPPRARADRRARMYTHGR